MTQAELFEEAARVVRMCECTDVYWWKCVKFMGMVMDCAVSFHHSPDHFEFALALAEGKPVWKGDVLYRANDGVKIVVDRLCDSLVVDASSNYFQTVSLLTWNPPILHAEWQARHEAGENVQVRAPGKHDWTDIGRAHRYEYIWSNPALEYRLKPSTIHINGKEYPKHIGHAGHHPLKLEAGRGAVLYWFHAVSDRDAVFQALTDLLEGK